MLFDRNITDGRAMMCSVLTLPIYDCRGGGDGDFGIIYDIYFPPPCMRLFDGPACNFGVIWRTPGRAMANDGLIVGTIIKQNNTAEDKENDTAYTLQEQSLIHI